MNNKKKTEFGDPRDLLDVGNGQRRQKCVFLSEAPEPEGAKARARQQKSKHRADVQPVK